MSRIKINPLKFIEGLRSGMTPEELIYAHGLNRKGFDQLVSTLQGRKLLNESDLELLYPERVQSKPTKTSESKNRKQLLFIFSWVLFITFLTCLFGFIVIDQIIQEKREAEVRHRARVTLGVAEVGRTAPEMTPPPGHEEDIPSIVRVGLYVDRIIDVNMPESNWIVDFYIWFNWSDENLDPGATFQVVEGEIEDKEQLENTKDEGGFYQLFRVKSVITKHFNTSRFPCDDHLMTIRIEDKVKQSYQLKFEADTQGSTVSSRVKIPGYEIYKTSIIVKPHSYKTRRGNTDLPEKFKATYSQFVYGLWVKRPGLGFFFKLFQGAFAAVAIALLAFFVKPTSLDPRFGLGVGAFFAAVANNYIASSLLPDTGIMTLADTVNAISMIAIFLTLVQSTISLHIYDRMAQRKLSMIFDRISFIIFLITYTGINVAIPLTAQV